MARERTARYDAWLGRLALCVAACVFVTLGWAQNPAPPPLPGGAVILDHVVAVINGSVILQSDIDEEAGIAVLQPLSVEATRDTPRRALQRLIDRALILQQMQTAETIAPPTAEEVQQRILEVRSVIPECAKYHCDTDQGWQHFLHAHGLTEQAVEEHWSQRILILSFIQSRFGAGVRITPAEIEEYYRKMLVPPFQAKSLTPPPLSSVSSRIQEVLLQQHVNSLLVEWLRSLKNEGSVRISDPAYGVIGTTGTGDGPDAEGQP